MQQPLEKIEKIEQSEKSEKPDFGSKLHFIGIGGIGMSAIAKIMLKMGFEISGSDVCDSELLAVLRDMGADIYIGHNACNLPSDADAVVYSNAISRQNPEFVKAGDCGIPLLKRAEALDFLMKHYCSIGVAGSHGKTTTSGMISLLLERCGLDPTIVIGGTLPQIGSNAKAGNGDYLVAEVDESDGTLLLLHPAIAVVTNIEEDHMDFYHTLEEIRRTFCRYVSLLPENGFAVVNTDNAEIVSMMSECPSTYITYSLRDKNADYYAENIAYRCCGSTADVYVRSELRGKIALSVPGEHNVSNALAALAVGMRIGIDFESAVSALSAFTGTGRRFELLGNIGGVTVIDDYAHHPTEIRVTLAAARKAHEGRLISVFQPHRYSRTQGMKKEFGESFFSSDMTIINEIYEAFETPIEGVSARLIVDEAKKSGYQPITFAESQDEIVEMLLHEAQSGDMVLVMGAGNIRSVGEKLVRELKNKN